MKGSTHLTIGIIIGAVAVCLPSFQAQSLHAREVAATIAVAGFSALAPDLDGSSMLVSRIGSLARKLRQGAIAISAVGVLAGIAWYAAGHAINLIVMATAAAIFLGLLTSSSGTIRNALVSLIGIVLLTQGWLHDTNWLIGLGVYVAWAPWLAHRGMTHTLWALCVWGLLGTWFEADWGITGIGTVATAGYASHLIADTLTPSGVKWLYPLIRRSLRLPRL